MTSTILKTVVVGLVLGLLLVAMVLGFYYNAIFGMGVVFLFVLFLAWSIRFIIPGRRR